MARKRDPRRDKAKKIWLESNGDKQLKEIASELNVSDSQISFGTILNNMTLKPRRIIFSP